MKRRRTIRLGALASTVLILVAAGPSQAGPVPATGVPTEVIGGVAANDRWLTLVTGDRLLVRTGVSGDELVDVRPAKGREDVSFLSTHDNGDLTVLPSDVAPLVRSGTVDSRLFAVSKLIEAGYDDRARADVPLILVSNGRDRTAAREAVSTAGVTPGRDLPSVDGLAVRAAKDRAGGFWAAVGGRPGAARLNAGVSRILLDGPVHASLAESVPQVGAPAAWAAGHKGGGATVAVLDTGIDSSHPDLADAVVESIDFSDSASGPGDRQGHGTHVASIITGNGGASDGRRTGVAPDARLLNVKVIGDSGYGSESGVIAGMEWAAGKGADVINMSLGAPALQADGTDLVSEAVNKLTAETNALFVVAAGNGGPDSGTVTSPGVADAALTVGAVSKQDELASFSSRGPRVDGVIKPDLTAPGVDIVAARASGTSPGNPVDDRYTSMSGTSMATPHVAGAAAVLAAQRPELTAPELKALLMGSAADTGDYSVYEQGAGRLDLARAATQGVFAQPASLSQGTVKWPHSDDTPIVKDITYRNVTDTPLTLTLTVDVRGPSGAAPAEGMFTLDARQVTVPAKGATSVTLTTDTRVEAPDGTWTGVVVATGTDGRSVVRTPIAVEREVESYDVTVTFRDRTGQPTPEYWFRFVEVARQRAYLPYDPSGSVVVRLPKGQHFFEGFVGDDQETPGGHVIFVEPQVTVTGNASISIDARDGRPFGVDVDRATARAIQTALAVTRVTDWGESGFAMFGGAMEHVRLRPSTETAAAGKFTFELEKNLAEPDGSGGFAGSPYLYHVYQKVDGRIPADPIWRVRDRDLAVSNTKVAATGPGQTVAVGSLDVVLATPASVTEYFTPGVTWGSEITLSPDLSLPYGELGRLTAARSYKKRERVTQQWNMAVFGPALPEVSADLPPWASRSGDQILVDLPLHTDQGHGHAGFSVVDSGGLVLYRDGEKAGESDHPAYGEFTVLPDAATYRMESVANPSASLPLSKRIETAWTFRSASVTSGPVPLSLMAVRFAPALDDHNRAPAGQQFSFPVSVQRQAGGTYGKLRTLTVQVSYDDGVTWKPVQLTGSGLNRTARVTHPTGPGFASLRATATDDTGNAVEQTIIRAYAF